MPQENGSNPAGSKIDLPINPEWEVHPVSVKEGLEKGEEMLLLDVRRLAEWNTARLDEAVLIPLHELGARALGELAQWKERSIVVYCHHGVRSLNAAAFLRKQHFVNVRSMAGGIEAWSLLVDPKVPRY